MTVIRVAHRKRFTVVAREAVNDERLSFRARGVLFWLLDKPDDWMVNAEQMAKQSPEGRDAIRAALRELEKVGYLRRESVQGDTGRWRTVTTIYESPAPENPSPVAGKPTPGKPVVGEPGALTKTVTEDCLPNSSAPSEHRALWDAMTEAVGEVITKPARSRRGKCINELIAVDASPHDVKERAAIYRELWPRIVLTDTGLVSRWSDCRPKRAVSEW